MGAANDSFGNAIAADAERVIIGSYRDDDNGSNSGAAYIYRRGPSGWEFEAKLVADDGEANDSFGISVGISGDHALVGAFWDDDNGTNAGAAYMFRYDGQQWVPQIKLLAADGAADDNFGVAVAIQGNTAVVGAQRDDDRGVDAGAVYVFMPEGDSWTQRYKLLPDENSSGDYFGAAVDIAADCLVIGAARDNQNGSQAGAVYVFERTRDEWSRDAKIVADDGSAYDEFGLAVACHGALLAVGAAQDDDLGSNSGATYLYRRVADVWVPVQKLLAADGSAGDRFGTALAVRDAEVSSVLISAPRHDEAGTDAGAAYLFQEVGSVWGQSAQLGSCDGQRLRSIRGRGDHDRRRGASSVLRATTTTAAARVRFTCSARAGARTSTMTGGLTWPTSSSCLPTSTELSTAPIVSTVTSTATAMSISTICWRCWRAMGCS